MNNSAEMLHSLKKNHHLRHVLKTSRISAIYLLFCIITLHAQVIIYSEGFEGNDGNYTHPGNPDWQWGAPSTSFTSGPATSNSGLNCWGTNLSGDVSRNCNAYLVSPLITLPNVTGNQVIRVRFFGWIAVDYMYDRGEFQISRDNATWSTLAVLFCTMQGGWNEYYFDITSYAGSQVSLRFRCYTDNSDAFSPPQIPQNNAGFYIDDIAITLTDAPSERTILTFEGNEDASASASCPYIFPWNGSAYVKDNDIYSTARGRNSEYTDYYLLQQQLVPSGNSYKLQIAETDQEESYTDLAQLVVVDHDPSIKIAPDEKGNIYTFENPVMPISAIDKNGNDISGKVAFEDSDGYPAHNNEFIELDFKVEDDPGTAIFVLRAKGFLTDSAGEGAGIASPPRILIQTQQGNGDWATRNVFYPRVESAVCAYDLGGLLTFSKKVRLLSLSCFSGKYHSVDYAGLDTASPKTLSITRLSPEIAVNSQGKSVLTRISAGDSEYVHMSSNDIIDLEFDKPALRDSMARDFIFISKGYYIPNGTYFFYTWDGAKWVQRDGWSIPVSTEQTRKFDLSLWLPDPSGEYKVRIWQDYIYHPAAIDFVGLTRGATPGTMVSATDLRESNSILSLVNSSDDNRLQYSWGGDEKRNRWVEVKWTGLSTNMPPSTNPVTIANQTSPTPQINWTYRDTEGDPQVQYEVEVWTSPNGTGSNVWDPAVGTGSTSSLIYAGLPLANGQTYYARVKAFDGTSWGGWSEASWSTNPSDTPPVAEAGPDQNVNAGILCNSSVTLDGTGSYDPDGGAIVTYTWSGPGGPLTGANPVVTLPVGKSKFILTVIDNEGSSTIDSVIITVIDTSSPVPTIASLPVIYGLCSVTLSPPTALDNCLGIISGTTTDSLSYTTQGTRTILWTYADANGNTSTQTQTVIIKDTTDPVPKVSSLPIIKAECSVNITTYPTAEDNCSGIITGKTSDSLSYTTQGTRTILWTYTDKNGNSSTQTQTVIVKDTTDPAPKDSSLPVIKAECSVNITTIPEALDNCTGLIKATTSDQLSYSRQGTYEIQWVYDDGNGNTVNQVQIVIVDDTTKPVAENPSLPVLRGDCSVELTRPYATDNCAGRIAGSTQSALSLNNQGTFTIVWIYDDGNGNVLKQNQTVIIKDSIPPVFIKKGSDTVLTVKESLNRITLNLDSLTAMDNCTKTLISASRSDHLPLDTSFFEGITKITWTACDTNGNCDSVVRKVTVKRNKAPVLIVPRDTSMLEGQIINLKVSASDSDGTVPHIYMDSCSVPYSFNDNNDGTATIEFRAGCTDNGVYEIKLSAADKFDTVQEVFELTIGDVNFDPVFDTVSYYFARETQKFNATFRVYDCDGTIPEISCKNTPPGASFIDNRDGTATILWTPDADDNGYYLVIFEARDGLSLVKDSVIIEVLDVNAFPPTLTLSATDTTCPVNQLLIIYIKAEDLDGTPPILETMENPSGASFTTDNEGNGIFRWTPKDTGVYKFTVAARDLIDSTSIVSRTVTIKVTDENVSGPVFTPHPDVVIDQNQRMELLLKAVDPDGTIPTLSLISKPIGAGFTDNMDGSGVVFWEPGCDISGTFALKMVATDGRFSDSIKIMVTVRDVNCAPVFYKIPDINAQPGEFVKVEVEAYDPDNNSQALFLSISCDLSGYTFQTKDDGRGSFGWYVNYSSGSYPVKFYVTDGLLTDSIEMQINVNKTGSVKISGYPEGTRIFVMPSGNYNGEYLGKDSAVFSAPPGSYSFQMQLNGYRPQHFICNVKADKVLNISRKLKPAIPLMLAPAETLFAQNGELTINSPFSLADLNGDGMLDVSTLTEKELSIYPGTDTGSLIFRPGKISITNSVKNDNTLFHLFVDWNNDKKYDCLYSDRSGNILVINLKDQSVDTILKIAGTRIYPVVYDVDKDNKKDLIVHSEGKGIFVYLNTGSDSKPAFQTATECIDSSGASLISMQGPFVLIDIDGDGSEEVIIRQNGALRVLKISGQFEEFVLSDNLNCAGEKFTTDSSSIFIVGSAQGMPVLLARNGNKLLAYYTRIMGDVNGDKKVDIRDISLISGNWEMIDSDPDWNPLCNLKLSTTGNEIIDIRDITRGSKCWELQE